MGGIFQRLCNKLTAFLGWTVVNIIGVVFVPENARVGFLRKIWKVENNLRNENSKETIPTDKKTKYQIGPGADAFAEFKSKLTRFVIGFVFERIVAQDDMGWVDSKQRTTESRNAVLRPYQQREI